MILQHAQQLRLQFERDLSNLIEKQSASIGKLHAADFLADRSRKGSLLVPEELTFQQTCRDRGTVDPYKGSILSLAQAMNSARDQLFSGAGFTKDEHRGAAA